MITSLSKVSHECREFPLSSLLILYERSKSQDTYTNYFEGFKLLYEALSPISSESLAVLAASPKRKLNKLEATYELQELAVILKTDQSQLLDYYNTTMQRFLQGY